jgi:hypothetical protein
MMLRYVLAALLLVTAPLAAGAQQPESTRVDPSGRVSFWIAATISEAALALASWNASLHDRPKDGPCKGERVDRPEHCSVVITASILKNEGGAAAAAIVDRVRNRPKSALRAYAVHQEILGRMAENGGRVDETLISGVTESLAKQVEDDGCAEGIRSSAVEYWLRVADQATAASYLRAITPGQPASETACRFTGKVASYRYALLEEHAAPGTVDLWMHHGLLSTPAKLPSPTCVTVWLI